MCHLVNHSAQKSASRSNLVFELLKRVFKISIRLDHMIVSLFLLLSMWSTYYDLVKNKINLKLNLRWCLRCISNNHHHLIEIIVGSYQSLNYRLQNIFSDLKLLLCYFWLLLLFINICWIIAPQIFENPCSVAAHILIFAYNFWWIGSNLIAIHVLFSKILLGMNIEAYTHTKKILIYAWNIPSLCKSELSVVAYY